jgi:hypothetical protein
MKKTILMMCAIATVAVAALDTIPAGTQIAVRTNDRIRAKTADGQVYTGVITNDVADANGNVVIARGANAELLIRRIAGNEIAVDLESLTVAGKRYAVAASENIESNRNGVGKNKRTGEFVGGGAVLGTILGAIAGGGKGAAIGAAAGAGAGAGTQMLTRGRSLDIPAESILTFRLEQPLAVNVHDNGYQRNGRHYHN